MGWVANRCLWPWRSSLCYKWSDFYAMINSKTIWAENIETKFMTTYTTSSAFVFQVIPVRQFVLLPVQVLSFHLFQCFQLYFNSSPTYCKYWNIDVILMRVKNNQVICNDGEDLELMLVLLIINQPTETYTAKHPLFLLRKSCQRGFCDIKTLIPSAILSRLIESIQ